MTVPSEPPGPPQVEPAPPQLEQRVDSVRPPSSDSLQRVRAAVVALVDETSDLAERVRRRTQSSDRHRAKRDSEYSIVSEPRKRKRGTSK